CDRRKSCWVQVSRGTERLLPKGGETLKGLELHLEGLFRLNREADRDVSGTVELFQHFVAKQATVLTLHARPRRQLDSAIAGAAGWTSEV
ncbi:MAG: hypothetical protein WB768_18825, partial [Bradyrhizobium sp.]